MLLVTATTPKLPNTAHELVGLIEIEASAMPDTVGSTDSDTFVTHLVFHLWVRSCAAVEEFRESETLQ